jgi:hypothetical protein
MHQPPRPLNASALIVTTNRVKLRAGALAAPPQYSGEHTNLFNGAASGLASFNQLGRLHDLDQVNAAKSIFDLVNVQAQLSALAAQLQALEQRLASKQQGD